MSNFIKIVLQSYLLKLHEEGKLEPLLLEALNHRVEISVVSVLLTQLKRRNSRTASTKLPPRYLRVLKAPLQSFLSAVCHGTRGHPSNWHR